MRGRAIHDKLKRLFVRLLSGGFRALLFFALVRYGPELYADRA